MSHHMGPREKDKTHVNAVKRTEMGFFICCEFNSRDVCLTSESAAPEKGGNVNVFDLHGVIFTVTALSILSKSFPPTGHCAIAKQLVISGEDWATSHTHENTHGDSRK